MNMTLVPINLICPIWELILPHVELLVNKNPDELTADGIKNRLLDGSESLLTITDQEDIIAIVTVQVHTYDTGKKALCILLTGGEDSVMWQEELTAEMDNLAKHFGCFQIKGLGARRGWVRSSTNSLFKIKSVTIYRDVS